MADDAQTILTPIQADQGAKADAWEAYTKATNENDLGMRLQSIDIPKSAKADLWEAKKRAAVPQRTPSPFTTGDFQTMPGSPIYNVNRLGSQPLPYASPGAAVSGAMARGQLPNFPQQVQQSGNQAAGYAPTIGATIGGVVAGLPGAAAGAGLGNIAESRMRGQPSSLPSALTDAALTYGTGRALEAGGSYVAKNAPRWLSSMAGFPAAAGKAATDYAEAGEAQTEAIRQRRIVADINRAKYEKALDAFESRQARIPEPASPTENLWIDLNKSIKARNTDIWVPKGATGLEDAAIMPGRGLAAEGLTAANLERLPPAQQNAVVAPLWNRAGQAVDQAAEAATQQGRTVSIARIDDAINRIEDGETRRALQARVLQMGQEIGIRGPQGWTDATPTQALRLRRALWNMGGDGEAAARFVTQALRADVPEMAGVDQHYADLNRAMNSIQRNMAQYGAGKFQFAAGAPEFRHPSYRQLPSVPDMLLPPAYKQIYNEQLKKLGYRTAAGAGIGAGALDLARAIYETAKK